MKIIKPTIITACLICLIVVTLLPMSLAAQDYNFIDQTKNIIIDPNNTLTQFYKNLNLLSLNAGNTTTGKEPIQVPIIHFGDSHTQGGYMTEVTRRSLQRKFGNAGRGFVTPLKLSRSNEPRDYSISSNTTFITTRIVSRKKYNTSGICGISLKPTNPNAQFKITLLETPDDPLTYNFTRIHALHSPNAPLITASKEILCNNSISTNNTNQCETVIYLKQPQNKVVLETYAHNEFASGEFYGFSLENNENGILYHTIGVNSATYHHWGRLQAPAMQSASLHPKLIIISLGANETVARNVEKEKLYRQIDSFVSKLKAANPKTPIILTTPIETMRRISGRTYPNTSYKDVVEVIKKYSAENNVACYDMYSIMGGANSSKKLEKEGLLRPDKIHFTIEGYTIQGKLLYNALLNSYERYIRENN